MEKEEMFKMLTGKNLIIGSFIIAFISMFMTWTTWIYSNYNGWDQNAWIILLYWGWYYKILDVDNKDKVEALYPIFLIILTILMIILMPGKIAGGPIIFLIALITLWIGVKKYNKELLIEKFEEVIDENNDGGTVKKVNF
jgi:hypothetical protein